MITSIRSSDGQKVIARDSYKQEGPFFCAQCQSEVVIHKGLVKVHHFAHKPPVTCQYGQGESEYHRKCKQEIFDCLVNAGGIVCCELERNLGKVVPDIYLETKSKRIAIEVQISCLTMNRIIERTEEYNRLGIYVLWLPIFNHSILAGVYSPKLWEKWLHATYYGRVYYWIGGLEIIPVHFDEHQVLVEESNWFTSDGDEMSAGGYYRKSKRYRTPNLGSKLNILKGFRATERDSWLGGDIIVPDCRILTDKHDIWWK